MVTEEMNPMNMNLFLRQISKKYAEDYILMVVDGASSHKGEMLKVPDNMAILCLPPYSPELNPAEHLWDELRENSASTAPKIRRLGVRRRLSACFRRGIL